MRFEAFTTWLSGRSIRERWLLALLLAIAVPLLVVLLIYQPTIERLEQAKQRHAAAVLQHGQVLAQLAQLKSVAVAGPTPSTAPLAIRVTDLAAQAGIRLSASEPRGTDRLSISLAPLSPTAGLRWLRQLESAGIRIQDLGISPQGQGLVTINAILAHGSAS